MAKNKHEQESLEDLIPKNPNMGGKKISAKKVGTTNPKKKRKRKKSDKQRLEDISSARVKATRESGEMDYYAFGEEGSRVNPFRDAGSFVHYYRYYISINTQENPVFSLYSSDVIYAGKILDDLNALGKKDNMQFLDGWIMFYVENHLKGTRIKKVDHTAIDKFHKTLSSYKNVAFLS